MSGTITVSSTTDSQEAVDAAAQYGEQTLPFPEEETPGTSEVEEAETAVESEPAELPENQEEEEAEEEEEPPETVEAAPRGKRDREKGLVAQVKRQAAQIAELEETVRKLAPAKPEPEPIKRPDASDPRYRGKGMEDVMSDMIDWKEQERKAVAEREKQESIQRQQQEWAKGVVDSYNQRITEGQDNYSDWLEVVEPLKVGPLAKETIMRTPNPADVWYYLGKNPDFFQQLSQWDGSKDAVDGNRIVQSLQNLSDQLGKNRGSAPAASSSSSSPQPRPAAPRPLRHVGGASAATAASVNPDKMSMREYNDWRNAGGGR